jgi:hypothetical protein
VIARKDAGWYQQTLWWTGELNEFFLEHAASNQCQVSMRPISPDYVAAWLAGLSEDDEVEFPQSGHSAISLPPKLKEEIAKVVAAEKTSKKEWLVQRLDHCVRDEQSLASLEKRAKRLSEIVEWTNRNPVSQTEPQTSKAV